LDPFLDPFLDPSLYLTLVRPDGVRMDGKTDKKITAVFICFENRVGGTIFTHGLTNLGFR